MPFNPDLFTFSIIGTKFQIFIRRPEVQLQIIITVLIATAAWLLSRWLWYRIQLSAHAKHAENLSLSPLNLKTMAISIGQAVSFSLWAIVGLEIAHLILSANGYTNGLLIRFSQLFWTFLIFQIVVTLLYAVLGTAAVRRYHYRLLFPLLIVALFMELLSYLVDLEVVTSMVMLTLFSNPITMGALFIATFGLYFWTDTVHAAQDFIYRAIIRSTNADPGSTKATLTLIRYGLILAGVAFALSQLKLDPTTIAAITGGLSIGVGFGMREILSNFISGIILLFERSLHPGDVIEINGQRCVVQNLSMRTTTVSTSDNIELVIPNQTFLTDSFKTYTGSNKRIRVPMIIQTSCDNDIEQVMTLLEETAQSHQEILKEPAPSVFFKKFGDNVAEFQINIWLDTPLKISSTTSSLRRLIWQAFHTHHIDLTFPDMALHFPSTMPPLEMQIQAAKRPLFAAKSNGSSQN